MTEKTVKISPVTRLEGHGEVTIKEFEEDTTNETFDLILQDHRSARLSAPVDELLTVTVVDSLSQESTDTKMITVETDNPPNAGNLLIEAPSSGFFNSLVKLTIRQIDQADDSAVEEVIVSILDITSGIEEELLRRIAESIREIEAQLDIIAPN